MTDPSPEKTILLVEDEALIAIAEAEMLKRNGYSVITVHSGKKAIAAVQEHPVDLVLMDIDLGKNKMDGTGAAEHILRERQLPIVFLSSHTEPDVVEKTEKITSYGYVVKNCGETVLIASIKMAFRLFEAHRQIKQEKKKGDTILQALPDMMFHLDTEGNILEYHSTGKNMYVGPEEIERKRNIGSLLPESFVRLTLNEIGEALKTGALRRYEYQLDVPGTGLRNYEARMVKLAENEVLTIVRDVTESKKNKDFMIRIGEMSRVGGWEVNLQKGTVYWSKITKEIHDVPPDYEPTLEEAERYFPGESGERITEAVNHAIEHGKSYELELDFVTAKGRPLRVRTIGHSEFSNGTCNRLYGTFQDISEIKELEQLKSTVTIQNKIMLDLYRKYNAAPENLYDYILEASVELTQSEYSFFGLLEDEESKMIIHAWSKEAMAECAVRGEPIHFPIAQAGIWGDCVRRRKPVIYNDYAADIPSKKGIPAGHVPIQRYLGFPIFDGEKIAAVGAVANKNGPYTQADIESLQLVYEQMWMVVKRKQAEELLRESEQRLEIITDLSTDYAYSHKLKEDGSLEPVWHIGSFDHITGYTPEELYEKGGWANLIHEDDIPGAAEYIKTLLSGKEAAFTARIVTKSGEIKWIEDRGRPWFDAEAGRVIGTYGAAREITSLKKVELGSKKQEERLRKIEWMLQPKDIAKGEAYIPEYGDLSELNESGLILSAAGKDQLMDIASEYLELLETSAAVYEQNGDYALGLFNSGWCRMMDAASRKLCGTEDNRKALAGGKWLCHESCWKGASLKAMETGGPVDIQCNGGIRLYAVPVRAGGEIIGAINFGYGDPPKDRDRLAALSDTFKIPMVELEEKAREYQSRPPFIINLAKDRLQKSALYIEQLVERDAAEQKLVKALEEKDFLMKELNHRVKNNLMMISSLINLKNSALENSADLSDIKHQIDAIRIVHTRLHQSQNITRIGLGEYLSDLLANLFSSLAGNSFRVEKSMDNIIIHTRRAVPVALIVNELATNAMKHGMEGNSSPIFSVELREDHETREAILTVFNNGPPISEEVSLDNPTTLGLRLISGLVEQLEGSIELQRSPTPVFTVRFPLEKRV